MVEQAGVQNWFYTKELPDSRSVLVAKVSVPALSPSQLTDINNTVQEQGNLDVWLTAGGYNRTADFTAPDYMQPVRISGSESYFIQNQFFELTNLMTTDNVPLFYKHQLPLGISNVWIQDLKGNKVTSFPTMTVSSVLYHSGDGGAYRLHYIDDSGYLQSTILRYDHVIPLVTVGPVPGTYTYGGRTVSVADVNPYWIRFTQSNGFQAMPMYNFLPNIPWFPRVRFGLMPPPVDWAQQIFTPVRPYIQASYVLGRVLDTHMIEFERKNIYYNPKYLPDILVFDSNNKFKYAIDGSAPGTSAIKGTVYNWQRGQIASIDPLNARVDLAVELDPTDIVYGFYNYMEQDVLYTGFDVNPFTNPISKNCLLQLYVKFSNGDPNRNIYHQLLDASGNAVAGQTNDPNPGQGNPLVFAEIAVGAAVSASQFSFTDMRVRGGGLAPAYQNIPQAVNFWDIGYWDGKPYPIGGALVVYLPLAILSSLSRTDVQGKVEAILPMGTLAVIRYMDNQGNEFI
jgi:hypothetical protein